MKYKVAVTGIGVISPIGNNASQFISSLKNGTNGIDRITLFDTTDHSVKIAGETNVILDDYFSYKGSKTKGVCGAFQKFIKENNIITRTIFSYGMGGVVKIII